MMPLDQNTKEAYELIKIIDTSFEQVFEPLVENEDRIFISTLDLC